MTDAKPRMHRLFAPDGKCFDVAVDHGLFHERAFLDGIEDLGMAVATLVAAGPDAIQLTPGQARLLDASARERRPALVLRIDVTNAYASPLPRSVWSEMMADPVELALRLDAACVVVNLLALTDQPDLHRQCVANIARLKPECERWGMPLMVEPLAMQPDERRGGYAVDGTLDKIVAIVRQAVELGADIIKSDPSTDITDYHEVVTVGGGVPILVRGGSRVTDEQVLVRTAAALAQGARGIVYGRNVIQHRAPGAMIRALMAVVHEGKRPEEALSQLVASAR